MSEEQKRIRELYRGISERDARIAHLREVVLGLALILAIVLVAHYEPGWIAVFGR